MNHSYSAPTRDTGRITKVFVNSIIGFLMKLNKSHDYVQINNKIIEKSNNQIIGQNVSGLILCKLAQCVSILAVSVSVLTLVAISWDRSWFFPGTGHDFLYIYTKLQVQCYNESPEAAPFKDENKLDSCSHLVLRSVYRIYRINRKCNFGNDHFYPYFARMGKSLISRIVWHCGSPQSGIW